MAQHLQVAHGVQVPCRPDDAAGVRSSHRPDQLTAVRLVGRPLLDGEEATEMFAQPGAAIRSMTAELLHVWDRCRTGDPARRAVGSLDLRSGAYFQWIGYADAVVVECSGNEYLEAAARLSDGEMTRLVGCGFAAPDEQSPNFWAAAQRRDDAGALAFGVVAALTSVFGCYAG